MRATRKSSLLSSEWKCVQRMKSKCRNSVDYWLRFCVCRQSIEMLWFHDHSGVRREMKCKYQADKVKMASLKPLTQLDGALKLAFGKLMAHKKSITRRGEKKVLLALTAITFTLTFFSFSLSLCLLRCERIAMRFSVRNGNRNGCDKFQTTPLGGC